MLIDSWYDPYLGVIILVRVHAGQLKKGMKLKMMGTQASYIVEKCGFFTPKIKYTDVLEKGEIGFITAGIKHVSDCKVGDTITDSLKPTNQPLQDLNLVDQLYFVVYIPLMLMTTIY